MSVTGKCLCGAVSYTIEGDKPEVGICHCSMCRRWTGGVNISFGVKPDEIAFEGEDKIKTIKTSPWAERAFCGECGSNLFYRVTAPGPYQGDLHVSAGTRDDWDGVKLTSEIFIDRKPDAYAFEGGDRKIMTEAEVMAMFAPPEGDAS